MLPTDNDNQWRQECAKFSSDQVAQSQKSLHFKYELEYSRI